MNHVIRYNSFFSVQLLCTLFRKFEEQSAGVNYNASTHIICVEFGAWSENWETVYKTFWNPRFRKLSVSHLPTYQYIFLLRFSFKLLKSLLLLFGLNSWWYEVLGALNLIVSQTSSFRKGCPICQPSKMTYIVVALMSMSFKSKLEPKNKCFLMSTDSL